MPASILWYDLETFGLDPAHDRIAQFACIRTDEELVEMGESIKMYCKPAVDYLPAPAACKVHGITPQTAWELGLDEYHFARRVLDEFSRPGTTVAGYNSVRFDDEFVRNLLYRNLFDPYEREYANGNSRWDAINLLRAARDLRPEGIVWPTDPDGTPVFKLEALAKANGVAHDSAHDALSDIRATIGLARLVKARQGKLYQWYYKHRRRDSLKPLIDLSSRRMLVHTSAEYTSIKGCSTLVAPVGIDPSNRNQLIALDLRFDPGELLTLSVDDIRARVFAKAGERDAPRVPLSRIKLNHCPFLAPSSTMSAKASDRLGIDMKACQAHLDIVNANPGLARKLVAVFDEPLPPPASDDPDANLYSGGFFPSSDREKLDRIHQKIEASGEDLAELKLVKDELRGMKFKDDRIPRLLGRLFARNFPETLSDSERLKWRDFCQARLQLPAAEGSAELADYSRLVETDLADPDTPAPARAIVHALLDWKAYLERTVISWGASERR